MMRGSSSASPFSCDSSRSAAAASAEPPPIPAATGKHLVERETAGLHIRYALGQQTRGLEHQIVRRVAAGLRQRSRHLQIQIGTRRQRQPVGAIGERHHAFEIVKAVARRPIHPQGQVDLGARLHHSIPALPNSPQSPSHQPPLPSSFFLSAEAAEEVSSGRPLAILASIFGNSSASGLRSRAWAHWNLASSVRPTRQ